LLSVSVLLNTTPQRSMVPSFAPRAEFQAAASPYGVALGDLNSDGRTDIVVSNEVDDTVSIFLNTTATAAMEPTLQPRVQFGVGASPSGLAIADIDQDGVPDVIVANYN